MERINQDSKQENPTSLHGTSDKAKALVRKGKGKSNKITNTFKEIGQRVEVRYNDGLRPGNEARYKGTLIEFNVKTGNWMARLDANILHNQGCPSDLTEFIHCYSFHHYPVQPLDLPRLRLPFYYHAPIYYNAD